MNITLLISNHCPTCKKAIEQLYNLKSEYPQITTKTLDVKLFGDKRIVITPAWIINNELYSYGEIDKEKFISKFL